MANNDHEVATKGDLLNLEQRFDTKLNQLSTDIDAKLSHLRKDFDAKLDQHAINFDTKLETIRDQIIRAFQTTEENIRQDHAHVDELASLETRVTRIEKHLAIDEH